MFLTVSRDLSTDKQTRRIEPLSNSTWSDKKEKLKNSDHNLSNDGWRKKMTLCQFPDLPIDFCEYECIEALNFDPKKPIFLSKWKFREPVENGALRTFFEHLY